MALPSAHQVGIGTKETRDVERCGVAFVRERVTLAGPHVWKKSTESPRHCMHRGAEFVNTESAASLRSAG